MSTLPHPYEPDKTAADWARIYGTRCNDPEWAAAEYITMFRYPMGGGLYVTQQNHSDIEWLYRVVCTETKLEIHVFRPLYNQKHDICAYEEMKPPHYKRPKQPIAA